VKVPEKGRGNLGGKNGEQTGCCRVGQKGPRKSWVIVGEPVRVRKTMSTLGGSFQNKGETIRNPLIWEERAELKGARMMKERPGAGKDSVKKKREFAKKKTNERRCLGNDQRGGLRREKGKGGGVEKAEQRKCHARDIILAPSQRNRGGESGGRREAETSYGRKN